MAAALGTAGGSFSSKSSLCIARSFVYHRALLPISFSMFTINTMKMTEVSSYKNRLLPQTQPLLFLKRTKPTELQNGPPHFLLCLPTHHPHPQPDAVLSSAVTGPSGKMVGSMRIQMMVLSVAQRERLTALPGQPGPHFALV